MPLFRLPEKTKAGGCSPLNSAARTSCLIFFPISYAPQGKFNLFSGGLFAKKAKLTGIYNDQCMT